MTRRLEELFQLDKLENQVDIAESIGKDTEETHLALAEIDATIDKIDAALPAIRDLNTSDTELDDIAKMATESFNCLTDLGMNVDSRFAAEIFAVAGNMLGYALSAKTTKLNKKLKIIELQLKKAKLDADEGGEQQTHLPIGTGHVLDRNELLDRLIGNRDQKQKLS